MIENDKRKNLVAFLTDAISLQMFEKAVRDFGMAYPSSVVQYKRTETDDITATGVVAKYQQNAGGGSLD